MEVGDARCKRIVFPDSHHASVVAERLQAFACDEIYPGLILERERELWVEYVEGRRAHRDDEALLEAFAGLVSVLMKRDPRQRPLSETPWLADLERDLAFLGRAGVLEGANAERLTARARALAPARVWEGYDCTDAIPKNFVWTQEGRLRAVDVESLGAGQLLGVGAAKATTRWLGDRRGELLERLREHGVPDFEPYFDFVELCFRAFWQKSSLLEGKRRFVDPGIFTHFLETP